MAKKVKGYCSNTKTLAEVLSMIRSALRRLSVKWKPRIEFLKTRRKPYEGSNKRLKWMYQCDECKAYKPIKEVHVDHITPCGPIRKFEDIGSFCERLYCEMDGFQLLCKPCHKIKSKDDNEGLK